MALLKSMPSLLLIPVATDAFYQGCCIWTNHPPFLNILRFSVMLKSLYVRKERKERLSLLMCWILILGFGSFHLAMEIRVLGLLEKLNSSTVLKAPQKNDFLKCLRNRPIIMNDLRMSIFYSNLKSLKIIQSQ